MGRKRDLSGIRFGSLVAVKTVGKRNNKSLWLFKCDCGSDYVAVGTSVSGGDSISCGCRKKTQSGLWLKNKDLYRIWYKMLKRCNNSSDASYKHYGGRGITVCDRWQTFKNFVDDMAPRPKGFSIDRIDNDKNYEPQNCKWSSHTEQARNKRTNRIIEFEGKSLLLTEWAEHLGIGVDTLWRRLRRKTPLEKALKLRHLREA